MSFQRVYQPQNNPMLYKGLSLQRRLEKRRGPTPKRTRRYSYEGVRLTLSKNLDLRSFAVVEVVFFCWERIQDFDLFCLLSVQLLYPLERLTSVRALMIILFHTRFLATKDTDHSTDCNRNTWKSVQKPIYINKARPNYWTMQHKKVNQHFSDFIAGLV